MEIIYVKFKKKQLISKALSEGIRRAKNNILIIMDADLQDHPEEILKFLKIIYSCYDLFSGWKKVRYDNLITKIFPSYIFKFSTIRLFNSKLKDINCGFKAYKKEIWNEINIYGDFQRFIPNLAAN